MITIYSCSLYSRHYDEEKCFNLTYKNKSNRKQWRYILDTNKANGIIITLPHTKSMLRKYFLQPHIDKDGYIISGDYECRLNNFTIKYKLINEMADRDIMDKEFEGKVYSPKIIKEMSRLIEGEWLCLFNK